MVDLNVVSRIKAPTPVFFKKLIKVGLMIGALGGLIVSLPTAGIMLPAVLLTIGKVAGIVGVTTSLVSKFTKEDFASYDFENMSYDELEKFCRQFGVNIDSLIVKGDKSALLEIVKDFVLSVKNKN